MAEHYHTIAGNTANHMTLDDIDEHITSHPADCHNLS